MRKLNLWITLCKIAIIGLLFVAPVWTIIKDYGGNKEIVKTTTTLHFGWIIVIGIICMVLLMLLYNALISYIRKNPFGFPTLLFFGGLVIILLIPVVSMGYTIKDLVTNNYELFLTNMDMYIKTLWQILGYQLGGIILIFIGFGLELQK